jgi:hypothetical protein
MDKRMVMCELIKEFCSACVDMDNYAFLRVCCISCHRQHLPNSKSNLNMQLTVKVLWLHFQKKKKKKTFYRGFIL